MPCTVRRRRRPFTDERSAGSPPLPRRAPGAWAAPPPPCGTSARGWAGRPRSRSWPGPAGPGQRGVPGRRGRAPGRAGPGRRRPRTAAGALSELAARLEHAQATRTGPVGRPASGSTWAAWRCRPAAVAKRVGIPRRASCRLPMPSTRRRCWWPAGCPHGRGGRARGRGRPAGRRRPPRPGGQAHPGRLPAPGPGRCHGPPGGRAGTRWGPPRGTGPEDGGSGPGGGGRGRPRPTTWPRAPRRASRRCGPAGRQRRRPGGPGGGGWSPSRRPRGRRWTA